MAPFPRSCGEHAFGWNHFEDDFRMTPSLKWQEILPWNRALKLSHVETFGQISDLVKEAREEFFSKHSYNFITEGTHNLSEKFRWVGAFCIREADYCVLLSNTGVTYPFHSPLFVWPCLL